MLIEVPEWEVILAGVAAFVITLCGIYMYYRRPNLGIRHGSPDRSYARRIEYYEKQLIEMKIRLDSLNLGDQDGGVGEPREQAVIDERDAESLYDANKRKNVSKTQKITKTTPNFTTSDVISQVLSLITKKPMTSRDIQGSINKTREHTSRLMKKLSEDGFVRRNSETRPYTYSITEQGQRRLAGA